MGRIWRGFNPSRTDRGRQAGLPTRNVGKQAVLLIIFFFDDPDCLPTLLCRRSYLPACILCIGNPVCLPRTFLEAFPPSVREW